MSTIPVKVTFEHGSGTAYDFPHVFSISDPKEGIKYTKIEGNRSSGCIIIGGGRKSSELVIRGMLIDSDGYNAITDLMDTLKSSVTTDVGTLTLQSFTDGVWIPDWSYQVRRVEEIEFEESLRTADQGYTVRFWVLSF